MSLSLFSIVVNTVSRGSTAAAAAAAIGLGVVGGASGGGSGRAAVIGDRSMIA